MLPIRHGGSLLALLAAGVMVVLVELVATAASVMAAPRQSLEDAWWTGPIVTPSAATLSAGCLFIGPAVFNTITTQRYDDDGKRRDVPRADSYGSLIYMLYGVTDRLTVGAIPTFGFNDVSIGEDSSRIGVGDVTVQAKYRLAQYREGGRLPTLSLVVQETLPTGEYDRLGKEVIRVRVVDDSGQRRIEPQAMRVLIALAESIAV